jgi:Zn-finger in ubiquitin-hydrolases and other protein
MTIPSYVVAGDAEGQPVQRECLHLAEIHAVTPSVSGACEDCLREGTHWVHLRLCLECGHMGCCDSSPRKHATAHHHATTHPIVRSEEPGEDWAWCYPDELFLLPAPPS